MAAIFQTVLMRIALCGLTASLVLFALQSRIARDTFARLLSAWRSLTAFGRFAVCSFLLIGILIGGDKTNSVPPNFLDRIYRINRIVWGVAPHALFSESC